MNRRAFLASAGAFALAPLTASAAGFVDYTPGLIDTALRDGKTVFVDYSADWCSTCLRQERVISALRQQNAAYDSAMMFVRVDWDQFKNAEVTKSRGVPRRSTLLVLRNNDELGRLVAATSESQIKALMDRGL